VPANFQFAGLGKRRVSLAYKAAGLGKRAGDWTGDYWQDGPEPEVDRYGGEPAFDEAAKRRVSTAMRYAGIGKRQRGRDDAGTRYAGVRRRARP